MRLPRLREGEAVIEFLGRGEGLGAGAVDQQASATLCERGDARQHRRRQRRRLPDNQQRLHIANLSGLQLFLGDEARGIAGSRVSATSA